MISSTRAHWWAATVLGVLAFAIYLSTITFLNDHYGRIVPGRQIVQYGELPFRDYLDAGYYLTEFSSAAAQWLFGDNLLGEALLNSAFVAVGTVLVFVLARTISGSALAALTSAVLALLSFPRAYDYDKVLFYPLGLLLCWRYAQSPTSARLLAIAAGIVAGGLYRYDTGVYIGAAAFVTMAVVHAGAWTALARRLGRLGAASACLALPFLAVIEYQGGLADAVDQMVTYGRRETARTRLPMLPALDVPRIVGLADPPPPPAVMVRWAPSIDRASRLDAEARHGLQDGTPHGEPGDRTWRYYVDDSAPARLRELLEDPAVEDTSGIERGRLRLAPEPIGVRAGRLLPFRLRMFPGAWHQDNANAVLYWLFRLLPLVAAAILVTGARRGHLSRAEVAGVSGLITVCAALNVFVLRDPVSARFGGMAGPTAVLAAWVACRAWRAPRGPVRGALRGAVLAVLAVTAWSLSMSAEWQTRLTPQTLHPRSVVEQVRLLAQSPPPSSVLPNSQLIGLIAYLRECTGVNDRILLSWFVPEVAFFAQRGFAAGMSVIFGQHWSEPRFQERSVSLLSSQSVPIVVTLTTDDFFQVYPLLAQYLAEHYESMGPTDFESPAGLAGGYTVFVRRDRAPVRTHPITSLPCY